jgi:SPP1 family predicted phage head-tail adaptor
MIESGRLDRLITFQIQEELSPAQDDMGTPMKEWVESFSRWAAYEPLGSREFPALEKMHSETTARWRIRYEEILDPTIHAYSSADYRISYNGTYWNMSPPSLPDRRETMTIETSMQPTPIEP